MGEGAAWRRRVTVGVPAAISVGTLLVLTLVIGWGAGHPERFPSDATYDAILSGATLLRLGPVFFSGLIIWPVMRRRGASVGLAAVGTLASPVAFAVLSALGQLTYFPPAEAAYYGLNPVIVAALGGQCAAGAAMEVVARWRRWVPAPLTARAVAAAATVVVLGLAVLYAGVIWDGGKHMFYLWMSGYTALFGTGQ